MRGCMHHHNIQAHYRTTSIFGGKKFKERSYILLGQRLGRKAMDEEDLVQIKMTPGRLIIIMR